ncbi:hypothetical protein C5748_18970 [Phyllobacterium phragmitis]|uniref:Uncharacterized protein n=1 Tax=Phyllobacterium phragmitis TaxID=2670329 RepID=A0A2S9IN53_9HYPH|nr:hypothetical protein C5748_18970 [Phyllobacterium phragmitis]
MCQRRPTDPTDPGDAADLSIMGHLCAWPAPKPATRSCSQEICAIGREMQLNLNCPARDWIFW